MTVGAGISAPFIAQFRKLCQEHHRARSNLRCDCDSKWARRSDAPCLGTPMSLMGWLTGSMGRRTGPQCEPPQQHCVSKYHEGAPPQRQCEELHEHLSPLHQQCEALHPLYWHPSGFSALNRDSVSCFAEMPAPKWDMMGRGAARPFNTAHTARDALPVETRHPVRPAASRELALPHAAVVASAPMFDVIATQLSAAAEKITHLRRFL